MVIIINGLYVLGLFSLIYGVVGKKRVSLFYSLTIFSLLFISIFTFKDINFGDDTYNYYNLWFKGISNHPDILSLEDPFFIIVLYLINLISADYYFFNFSFALIFLGFLIISGVLSKNKYWPVFVILLLFNRSFLDYTSNLMRGQMSGLVMFLGLIFILRRKYLKSILTIVSSYFFHSMHFVLNSITYLVSYFLSARLLKIIFLGSFIVTLLKYIYSSQAIDDMFYLFIRSYGFYGELPYGDSQLFGKSTISTSLFIQHMLYFYLPTSIFIYDNKDDMNMMFKISVVGLAVVSLLYPYFILSHRLLVLIILTTQMLVINVNKKLMLYYSVLILLLNLYVLNTNLDQFNLF